VGSYSIRDLEHLSGIKAHTLRIWEQRYNFISPGRSDTNIRFYTDDDLRLILNISLLKDNGFRISRIAEMSEKEMQEEVLKLTEKHLRHPNQIHALTIAMVDMDEERFEKILNTCILQMGFERTIINVVYPFLSRIGVLWQTGSINPANEHFMSHLIRQKIIVAIDGQVLTSTADSKTFLLFLPEGELHEITLLFSNYIIRSRGFRVIYLGQNMPLRDLETVKKLKNPEFVLSIITSSPDSSQIQEYVLKLGSMFEGSKLLLSGYQVIGQDLDLTENTILLPNLQNLIDFVDQEKANASRVAVRA
jgi:DNA-binding transcriptional MerR regulator